MHHAVAFLATAYAPGCGDSGRTATGTRPHIGTVAVDRYLIPLHTRFFIRGMYFKASKLEAIAEDTGGNIKGYRVDIWFPRCSQALAFGTRTVRVFLPHH